MRSGVVAVLALVLCSAADARPKPARRGTFADCIETNAPVDPPRPPPTEPAVKETARPPMVIFVVDRTVDDLEAAKKLVVAATAVLVPSDYVSVVVFDSDAQVYVRPTRVTNLVRIGHDVQRLQRGFASNVFSGLKEAFEVSLGVNAASKTIVLVTDGNVAEAGLAELLDDMQPARIRTLVVGTPGGDRLTLVHIADWGHGKLLMLEDDPGERALLDELRAIPRDKPRPSPAARRR